MSHHMAQGCSAGRGAVVSRPQKSDSESSNHTCDTYYVHTVGATVQSGPNHIYTALTPAALPSYSHPTETYYP